jgi:GNAT superfamily N-acetyltransferase
MSPAARPFALRHAEPEDHGYIVRVVDAWWGGRRMADMIPKLFFVHFRPTSFVAEADALPVGFLAGFRSQTDPDQGYVHFVGVDPRWRAQGVAHAMYDRFFDTVRALGCREVRCVTSPSNRGSLAFHAALGFEVLPGGAELNGVQYVTDYDGLGESRVLLRRLLGDAPGR